MGNAIPQKSRRNLHIRDNDQCQRCGQRGYDYHHRRRRAVKTHYQHCMCNAVLLCRTCHAWAHAHPTEAAECGFIVSAFEDNPYDVPIKTFQGWMKYHCDTTIEYIQETP